MPEIVLNQVVVELRPRLLIPTKSGQRMGRLKSRVSMVLSVPGVNNAIAGRPVISGTVLLSTKQEVSFKGEQAFKEVQREVVQAAPQQGI